MGLGSIDLMISHDGPSDLFAQDYRGMAGSQALRFLISETQPALAFFAHYDRVGEWSIGSTRVFGMGKCGYVPSGAWPVARHGIAVVGWTSESLSVERLNPDWLRTATRTTWRHWGKVR
jgi:Icc-related predicted phosphoesterase